MKNKLKQKVTSVISVIQIIIGLGWLEVSTMLPVFADVEGTIKGVESGLGDQLKKFANPALGIAVVVYGAARFLGHDISSQAKKWVFSAFIGAAVIVNASWLRNLLWGWLGG